MSTEYKSFQAFSGDEKGSTGFYAKIEDGKVAEIIDASTYETDEWWGIEKPPYYLVGESSKELSEVMKHYYRNLEHYSDDSNVEYYGVSIREEAISKEEYEREKLRLKKEEIELQQRGIEYKFFEVLEPDYGPSTGFYAKIENGKVAEIIDVSIYKTDETKWGHNIHYDWDMAPPYDMIGKSGKELSEAMAHYYDDKDFGDRRPWIAEENLREQEYEMKARNAIERDGVVYKSFKARESDVGGSGGFYAKIENGKVTEIVDISTHETNFVWDIDPPYEMVGKSGKELLHLMHHYLDTYEDDYRRPWILEENLSEQEYEQEARRSFEVYEVRAERKRARAAQQGTDKFAEREDILREATERILAKHREKEEKLAGHIRDEKYYARRLKNVEDLLAKLRKGEVFSEEEVDDVCEGRPNRRTLRSRGAASAKGKLRDLVKDLVIKEKDLVKEESKLTREEKQAIEEYLVREVSGLYNGLKKRASEVSDLLEDMAREEKKLDKKVATARVVAAKKHIIGTERKRGRVTQGTDKFAAREAILREATEKVLAKHREKEEKLAECLAERVDYVKMSADDLEDAVRLLAKLRKGEVYKLTREEKLAREVSRLRDRLKEERKEVSEARKELAKDEKNLDKEVATARVAAAKKHMKESR